jgi:pimeloyl-ACP methyl ester carboxylesterase
MDWTNPNAGEKLKLRLVRLPAAADTPNAKSIIVNPGGPGASGIKQFINGTAGYQDVVGNSFHIISFDPRGVGLTTPYTCPKVADSAGPYNTDEGLAATFAYNKNQSDACANAEYSTLIGTAFVARDINAIAEAIGEDGLIRYWGYSYGTLLGATVAAIFPNKVDRVLLDGNINPNDYYRGL